VIESIRGDLLEKLTRDFYEQDTLWVAKQLLGKKLVRVINSEQLICTITDVEAYTGILDRACHSYGGRRTDRTEVLWGEGGHVYVYMIYGMYYMLNVVTEPQNVPCAVLIRGVQPITSLNTISQLRYDKIYDLLSKNEIKNLSNGPGKVCKALQITKQQNELDLLGDEIYILDAPTIDPSNIHVGKRINIDYAGEAKDYLYRFYL